MKSLDFLSTSINERCENIKTFKNILIFGPPGSGIEIMGSYINDMVGVSSTGTYSPSELYDLSAEAICLINDPEYLTSECKRYNPHSDFAISAEESYKILAKKMYLFRSKMNRNSIFVYANYTLSDSLAIWRTALDDEKCIFIFSVSDPTVAALQISQTENISFELAVDKWVNYFNKALKFIDTFRGNVIMLVSDGQRYSKLVMNDLQQYFISRGYLSKDDFNIFNDDVIFRNETCSEKNLCTFELDDAAIELFRSRTPGWVKKCFEELRESQNQPRNNLAIIQCIQPI
jgi:hypothetical protein